MLITTTLILIFITLLFLLIIQIMHYLTYRKINIRFLERKCDFINNKFKVKHSYINRTSITKDNSSNSLIKDIYICFYIENLRSSPLFINSIKISILNTNTVISMKIFDIEIFGYSTSTINIETDFDVLSHEKIPYGAKILVSINTSFGIEDFILSKTTTNSFFDTVSLRRDRKLAETKKITSEYGYEDDNEGGKDD